MLEERRAIYRSFQNLPGRLPGDIFEAAKHLGEALILNSLFEEARVFLKEHIDRARRELGPDDTRTLFLSRWYGEAIVQDEAISGIADWRRELEELVDLLDETSRKTEQIWGADSFEVKKTRYLMARVIAKFNPVFDPDTLRFKIGDRVECATGADEWLPGTVVAHNHVEPLQGAVAAYRIRLDKGDHLIFAPADDPRCIRQLLYERADSA